MYDVLVFQFPNWKGLTSKSNPPRGGLFYSFLRTVKPSPFFSTPTNASDKHLTARLRRLWRMQQAIRALHTPHFSLFFPPVPPSPPSRARPYTEQRWRRKFLQAPQSPRSLSAPLS